MSMLQQPTRYSSWLKAGCDEHNAPPRDCYSTKLLLSQGLAGVWQGPALRPRLADSSSLGIQAIQEAGPLLPSALSTLRLPDLSCASCHTWPKV